MLIDKLLARDLLPDWLIRQGIRHLNRKRLRDESRGTAEERQERFTQLCDALRKAPIALFTREANDQHYELPPRFFELCLGDHLKYSACYWDKDAKTLSQAEKRMLDLYIERAELADGMSILELGCGWGSLTVEMARRFPRARITAVSNSKPQRLYIQGRLKKEGLRNVEIITADMNDFKTAKKFQRIVSIEMFEHMRNYELLFKKVAGFLAPRGKLFLHIFNHERFAYIFETSAADDWMGRYFFTGGIIPSKDLYLYFSDPLRIERVWSVDGTHYQKTSEAWLANMDANRAEILEIFKETYGADQAVKWFAYWRVFYMAVAELFGMYNGREWQVTHYRFVK